jgi:hypothetical protein
MDRWIMALNQLNALPFRKSAKKIRDFLSQRIRNRA